MNVPNEPVIVLSKQDAALLGYYRLDRPWIFDAVEFDTAIGELMSRGLLTKNPADPRGQRLTEVGAAALDRAHVFDVKAAAANTGRTEDHVRAEISQRITESIRKVGEAVSTNIRSQSIIATYTLRGHTFDVQLTEWTNSDGASYDVRDHDSHFALHDESLNTLPTEGDIRSLIFDLANSKGADNPTFFDKAEVAVFLKSLTPEYTVSYEIRTGISNEVVHEASTTIEATNKNAARTAAITWVQTNDPSYDDRIDPRVVIVEIHRLG